MRKSAITNRFLADRYKCIGGWGRDLSQFDAIFLLRPIVKRKKAKKKEKKRKKSLIARTMAVSFKPSRDKRLCTTRRVDLNRGDPIVPFGDRIDLGLVFFNCNQLFDEEEKTFFFFSFLSRKHATIQDIKNKQFHRRLFPIISRKIFLPFVSNFSKRIRNVICILRNIY